MEEAKGFLREALVEAEAEGLPAGCYELLTRGIQMKLRRAYAVTVNLGFGSCGNDGPVSFSDCGTRFGTQVPGRQDYLRDNAASTT